MNLLPSFDFSPDSRKAGMCLPFGLLAARDVSSTVLEEELKSSKALVLQQLRGGGNQLAEGRVASFSDFFSAHGFSCPLARQMRGVMKNGFPRISAYVDALLVCEMSSGLLMGVQDLDSIEGEVTYDLAYGGEAFQSLRDTVTCKAGEIVLRDERSIIASYFQGPNHRVNVTAATTSILFFVFGAPNLDQFAIGDALKLIAAVVSPSAKAIEMKEFGASFNAICKPIED